MIYRICCFACWGPRAQIDWIFIGFTEQRVRTVSASDRGAFYPNERSLSSARGSSAAPAEQQARPPASGKTRIYMGIEDLPKPLPIRLKWFRKSVSHAIERTRLLRKTLMWPRGLGAPNLKPLHPETCISELTGIQPRDRTPRHRSLQSHGVLKNDGRSGH